MKQIFEMNPRELELYHTEHTRTTAYLLWRFRNAGGVEQHRDHYWLVAENKILGNHGWTPTEFNIYVGRVAQSHAVERQQRSPNGAPLVVTKDDQDRARRDVICMVYGHKGL